MRAHDQELATAAAISTLHTTWLGLAEVGFETTIVSKFIPGSVSFIPDTFLFTGTLSPLLAIADLHLSQLEDFYDVLRSLVEQVITPKPNGRALNASLLLEAFTSPEGM
jgi:ubiquitin thioesterase protein OTUB1